MLEGVRAAGDLRGLLLTLTVEQRFRNTAATNSEVVYRFPLPCGAVLLGVEVVLGGRRLTGTVVEKRQAEARYEEALCAGQAAIMLERNPDGSYSLNLGNLLAGETCLVTLRYAQVLQFEQGGLRLLIPTLIAPRYGDPVRDGGLQPHQALAFDPLAAYPFDLRLCLHGELARARVASPSHPIAVGLDRTAGGEVLTVTLARQGALDRDFVLVVDRLAQAGVVVMAPDPAAADPVVVLASFCPRLPARTALAVKVLVDCSGSMAGDSIAAARRALQAVLGQLGAADRFCLSRFGSQVEHRSRGLWTLTEATRLAAQRWVGALEADLGGTEMARALESTCALAHGGASDLLLVTDGEIEAIERTIAAVRGTGHRVFAVGIGASPAAGHLRRLAEATAGACDFVAPGEAVEPAVLRMFARLRSPRLTDLTLVWPEGVTPGWVSPLGTAVFDGDTVNAFAWLGQVPAGAVRLLGASAPGAAPTEIARADFAAGPAPAEPQPAAGADLARVAAAARIQALATADATATPAIALAVAYQLVTDRTNFLLVQARAAGEAPTQMPELHQVAQMLPAGWGGTGSVMGGGWARPGAGDRVDEGATVLCEPPSDLAYLGLPAFLRRPADPSAPPPPDEAICFSVAESSPAPQGAAPYVEEGDLDYLEIPETPSAPYGPVAPPPLPAPPSPSRAAAADEAPGLTPLALCTWLRRTPRARWPRTYADLRAIGLGTAVLEWLELVIAPGHRGSDAEGAVVAAFLHCLSQDALYEALAQSRGVSDGLVAIARDLRTPVAAAPTPGNGQQVDSALAERILAALQGVTAGCWPDMVYALAAPDGLG